MSPKSIIVTGVSLLVALDLCHGCTPHAARRKKRLAPQLAQDLAEFFGNCAELRDAANGVLPSLPSVVDSVIRDTNWYRDVSTATCTGAADNSACWIAASNYLMTLDSTLQAATKICMVKWAEQTPGAGGGRRKRATGLTSGTQVCVDGRLREQYNRYPSLRNVDVRSIEIFLLQHYTRCRAIPKPLPCPTAQCRRFTSTRNVTEIFIAAIRTDSPLFSAYLSCQDYSVAKLIDKLTEVVTVVTVATRGKVRSSIVNFYSCSSQSEDLQDLPKLPQLEVGNIGLKERNIGTWSPWRDVSSCGRTCDSYVTLKRQVRSCRNGRCPGPSTRAIGCPALSCGPRYNWTGWTLFADCKYNSATGGCSRRRTRYCSEKRSNGGLVKANPQSSCSGSPTKVENCACAMRK